MAFPSTFQDIQQEVIAKLRLDPVLDLQKTKDWINAAYAEACMETEFFVTSGAAAALTANASSVTVPATVLSIDYIVSTGPDGTIWAPMNLVPLEEILRRRAYAGGAVAQQGAPMIYTFRSSGTPTIEFWPNAAGGEVMTFYGDQLPTPLSANGDLPIIPEPYGSNVLTFGAAAQAAEFKQNFIMMGTYQQESESWLRRLRGFQNNRPGNKTQQFQIEGARQPVPPTNAFDVPYNW